MHTFRRNNVVIQHNSDMSGDIYIFDGNNTVVIPGEVIVEFMFEKIKNDIIGKLEDLSLKDLMVGI